MEMGGGGQAAVAADGAPGQIPQQFSDVLISAIPTEPLAAYTAILGVAASALSAAQPRAYLPFKWASFAAFVLITVLAVGVSYRRKVGGPGGVTNPASKRAFPWAEGVAALVAATAWGLAMPGSALNSQVTGTVATLTAEAIVIGGATILTLTLGPPLKTGTSKPGDPAGDG